MRFRPYSQDFKIVGLLGLYCCALYLWNLPYTELVNYELGPSEPCSDDAENFQAWDSGAWALGLQTLGLMFVIVETLGFHVHGLGFRLWVSRFGF